MAPRIWEVESGSGTLHPLAPFCIFTTTTTHSNGGPHFYVMRLFHSLLVDNILFFSFSYSIRHQPAVIVPSHFFFLFFIIPPPLFLKSLRGLLPCWIGWDRAPASGIGKKQ
jgi:hypothetical protein